MAEKEKLYFSPSSIERVFECPGSAREITKYPDQPNSFKHAGTLAHSLFAMALDTGDQSIVNDVLAPHGMDVKKFEEAKLNVLAAVGQVNKVLDRDFMAVIELEHQVDLSSLGFWLKADRPNEHSFDFGVVFANKDNTYDLVILDYKSGSTPVPHPSVNRQLKTYAFGWFKELQKKGCVISKITLGIVQPALYATPQTHKFDIQDVNAWGYDLQDAIHAAQAKDAPLKAGPWCKNTFCPASDHCPAYQAFKQEKRDAKELEAAEMDAKLTASPVLLEISEDLAKIGGPIMVLSAEVVAEAQEILDRIEELEVNNSETSELMSALLQKATAWETKVEKNRGQVKAPVLALGKKIDDCFKQASVPLGKGKDLAKARLGAFLNAERARIEAEERKRREEMERLVRETREAEAKAVMAKNAKARKEAEEAAAKARQAEAQAASVPVPQAPKAPKGIKQKVSVTYTCPDISKVPDKYTMLVLNDALISAAIEAGQITEKDKWIQLTETLQVSSTGRR